MPRHASSNALINPSLFNVGGGKKADPGIAGTQNWLDPNFQYTTENVGTLGLGGGHLVGSPAKTVHDRNQQASFAQGSTDRMNTHAERYRTDPAYRAEWDKTHGGSVWDSIEQIPGNLWEGLESFAGPLATAATLAYGGNALLGAAPAAGGTTAAGVMNPTGAGFTGTGPGVASMGGSAPFTASAGITGGIRPSTNTLSQGNSMNYLDPLLNVGGSLVSGYLSHEATGEGIDEIARQYDQTRADFEPWRTAGVNALNNLTDFNPEADPIYQFQLEQSQRALERALASRGHNMSGNALLELQRNAIGEAGRYQNDIWNRQAGLAGVGQAATSSTAGHGANAAANIANLNVQQGAGLNNAFQGGINNYLTSNYLRRYG